MRNELNLFIMTSEDAINWYKPQTEEESYLVKLLSNLNSKAISSLEDEIVYLRNELDEIGIEKYDLEQDIENQVNENANLIKIISDLENTISDLEDTISELEINIKST